MFGKRLGRSLKKIGRKVRSTRPVLRKALSTGRQISDNLSNVNRGLQKAKGAAVLAGPYAPALLTGIEGVNQLTMGVSAGRQAINSTRR